jgi:hypothetical protein
VVHDEAQRRVTQAQDGFLRKSRGLLLCGILLATTVGCGVSRPHPTLAELKRTPGAELTYPGSMPELAGQADSNRKFGVNPAFFGERGFTNASSSEVFAFFDRMLQQEGWTRRCGA